LTHTTFCAHTCDAPPTQKAAKEESSMVDTKIEKFADGLVFGEGMRWYGNRVWISDMLGRVVLSFDLAGNRTVVAKIPARPNGVGFLPDGSLLATSMADQKLIRVAKDGSQKEHSDLSGLMTGYCGDIAVDSKGRAYLDDVGFRVFEGAPRAPGRLLLVQPDGRAEVVDDDLQFPNGIWISQNEEELIFAEGRNQTIWSYRIGENGALSNKQPFANLCALLDGLTLDAEGAVWVCQPYEHRIIRVLRGGQITHKFEFGELKPVACCLGGPKLTTLFVVAADYTLERMAVDDTSALIFKIEVDVPGFLLPGDPAGR
jgi:sugar lactone lactonase YvrE